MSNTLGIRKYDYIEFYVGSAKMVAFWYARAMGLQIKAYSGFETGNREKTSYFLQKNDLKIVISSALKPENDEIQNFLKTHGDGVKRWAYEVDDVKYAYDFAVQHGAKSAFEPRELKDHHGVVLEAGIKIYDDSEIIYVNYDQYKGLFKPGYAEPVQKIELQSEDTGLMFIDHVVGNVREKEMDQWAEYFNKVMDFETFVDFGPGDISTKYSALLSKVVRSKDETIKNPINEPYKGLRKSQIQEYIEEYRGSGIQHVAIATSNIIKTIEAMKKNGMEFLDTPKSYYELLKNKGTLPDENIDELAKLGILCDFEDVTGAKGYLLQLFTKPIGDRPSFFFEIIQRKGESKGFGQGNFQSLFESIEMDQAKRGNL